MVHDGQKDEQKRHDQVYEPPEVKLLGSLKRITKGPLGGTIDSLFSGIGGFTS